MIDVFILTSEDRANTLGYPQVQIYKAQNSDTVVSPIANIGFQMLANADHVFYLVDGYTKYLKCRTEEYQYSVDEVLILKLKATQVRKS